MEAMTSRHATLHERLLARRQQLDLSLDELAERVTEHGSPVAKNSVWKWETGQSRPTRDRLAALAQALELDEDTVLGWWAGLSSLAHDRGPVQERYDAAPRATRQAIDMLLDAAETSAAKGDGPEVD